MRPAGLPAKPRVTASVGSRDRAPRAGRAAAPRRPAAGRLRGLLPGPGSDTGEARPYVAGDDTRHIDWAVTARTTEPHVRDTIADRELELWLVVDASKSLDFGTARSEKRDVAWAAAGAFALLAARGGNRVGALTTASTQATFPARSTHAARRLPSSRAAPAAERRRRATGPARSALPTVVASHRAAASSSCSPTSWLPTAGSARCRRSHTVTTSSQSRSSIRASCSLPDVGLLRWSTPRPVVAGIVDTHDRRLRERYAAAAAGGASHDRRAASPPPVPTTSCCAPTATGWSISFASSPGGAGAACAAAGGRR